MSVPSRLDAVAFATVERRLKAFVIALWRRSPPLRARPHGAPDQPLRANFDGGLVRLPESFRGYSGGAAIELFFATVAHVAAHLQFGSSRFAVGGLKPLQVALVSLVEDARVEQLALQVYPGLRRYWLPHHVATATGAVTAPALLARLARALIDPDYRDDNGWVSKGRTMFFAERERWHDASISRTIGSLLGNDLGQMRVQFNAKSYVVEPVYRDDNMGLWDFGEAAAADDGTVLEAVRLNQTEGGASADRAAPVRAEAEVGVPVARYPEWDFLIGRDRAEWTTLVEYGASEGPASRIDAILERHPVLVHRITTLIRSAKVSRPLRLRRQPEGDRLDLEACISATMDHRAGHTPDFKVYAKLERRYRDLAVLLLLDVSQSTNDIVRGAGSSVLELEREAAALLAHAMAGLGDPFAIHAFCSDTRADVRYFRVKDFGAPYDAAARRHLAGLTGRYSTRMGAALRHAGRELAAQRSHRRLLLMVSDGEPSDVDVADRRYLVEDARHAILAMAHFGIDVFCVGLDADGDSYLTRIFGRRNVLQVDRVERLPEKLPMLYFRLTG
ncbi:MAG: VWA domain-containing protein [Betaproteobacteria bacterium]|nr:VWA domain-containing protein [Betaproteobacteria bacterium]